MTSQVHQGVSNHRLLGCLLKNLFWLTTGKTSKLRINELFVRGILRWPVDSPHYGPVTPRALPCHYVILYHCLHVLFGRKGDQNLKCTRTNAHQVEYHFEFEFELFGVVAKRSAAHKHNFYPMKYACGLCFALFCCGLVMGYVNHMFQGSFTGTETMIRLPLCQWRYPEEYGWINHNNPLITI